MRQYNLLYGVCLHGGLSAQGKRIKKFIDCFGLPRLPGYGAVPRDRSARESDWRYLRRYKVSLADTHPPNAHS